MTALRLVGLNRTTWSELEHAGKCLAGKCLATIDRQTWFLEGVEKKEGEK